ncbi:MAG: tRNA-dihydrouridine synthase [PVC group bacterium]
MNSPSPLKIGDLVVEPPFILAPMAGYTQSPFRGICLRFGCGLVFTEVVTAEGVCRRSPPTMHYLATHPEEEPVVAHLYGDSPGALAAAAAVIESLGRFSLIDINCGCPVPKIMRKGAGAALMKDPGKIRDIVREVSRAVTLPVTVKTRLGVSPDRRNIYEILRAVEEGGGKALFLHGRFAGDRHGGPADWEAIGRVKEQSSIPVIGNGGITTAGEAVSALERYGVDGVMIGRAALGNPWLFEECRCLWSGKSFTPPTDEERYRVIAEHLEVLYRHMLEEARIRGRPESRAGAAAGREFYGHLVRYLAGRPGLGDLRKVIAGRGSIEELLADVARLLPAGRK